MNDQFSGQRNPTMSARTAYAVTPSDTEDLAERPVALFVAAEGNIVARMQHPVTAAWANLTFPVTAGQVLPVSPRRIMAATTATVIALCWGDDSPEA